MNTYREKTQKDNAKMYHPTKQETPAENVNDRFVEKSIKETPLCPHGGLVENCEKFHGRIVGEPPKFTQEKHDWKNKECPQSLYGDLAKCFCPTNQETPEPTQEKHDPECRKGELDGFQGAVCDCTCPEQKDFVEGWEEEFYNLFCHHGCILSEVDGDLPESNGRRRTNEIMDFIRKVEATAYAQGEQDMAREIDEYASAFPDHVDTQHLREKIALLSPLGALTTKV